MFKKFGAMIIQHQERENASIGGSRDNLDVVIGVVGKLLSGVM